MFFVAEHRTPGVERVRLVEAVDKDDAEFNDADHHPICYYIVGGNKDGVFTIDHQKHILIVSVLPQR